MTTTGWSSEVFDNTPMPVILDLLEYWGDNPPVHMIEAAKAGLGKRKQAKKAAEKRQQDKPKDLTEEEKKIEESLPPMVREIRQKQREERLRAWEARNQDAG